MCVPTSSRQRPLRCWLSLPVQIKVLLACAAGREMEICKRLELLPAQPSPPAPKK